MAITIAMFGDGVLILAAAVRAAMASLKPTHEVIPRAPDQALRPSKPAGGSRLFLNITNVCNPSCTAHQAVAH